VSLPCTLVQSEGVPVKSMNWTWVVETRRALEDDTVKVIEVEAIERGTSFNKLKRVEKASEEWSNLAEDVRKRGLECVEYYMKEPTISECLAMLLDPRIKNLFGQLCPETNERTGQTYLEEAWEKLKEEYEQHGGIVTTDQQDADEDVNSSFDSESSSEDEGSLRQTLRVKQEDGAAQLRSSPGQGPQSELEKWKMFSVDAKDWMKYELKSAKQRTKDKLRYRCNRGIGSSHSFLFKSVDVLQFWKAHEAEFPVMAKLACVYLGAPSAESYAERTFSCGKKVMGMGRTGLDPERFEACVVIRMNKESFCSRA